MTGNCRGPSTAFCLLYKFFTKKLTVKQMHGLLKHPDYPYIRAIGFLYLRYAADLKTLWNWLEPYVKDEEEFSPRSNGRMTTMGAYVHDLLLGQVPLSSNEWGQLCRLLSSVAPANLSTSSGASLQPTVTAPSPPLSSDEELSLPLALRKSLPLVHQGIRRDNGRQDYERSGGDSDRRRRESISHRSRSRSRSRSGNRSMQIHGSSSDCCPSPFGDKATTASRNLAQLKDLYGNASDKKGDSSNDRLRKDSRRK